MLLSYEDFRSRFEALGIAEAEGRGQLEALEILLDPFVIEGLAGNLLGTDGDLDSDPATFPVDLIHYLTLDFNGAAHDEAAGKKET